MDEHMTAVALLWSVEPTDRALAGWRPRVWIALDTAIFAKEWQELAQRAPSRWAMRWFEETG